jgi:hypothetical protein
LARDIDAYAGRAGAPEATASGHGEVMGAGLPQFYSPAAPLGYGEVSPVVAVSRRAIG